MMARENGKILADLGRMVIGLPRRMLDFIAGLRALRCCVCKERMQGYGMDDFMGGRGLCTKCMVKILQRTWSCKRV